MSGCCSTYKFAGCRKNKYFNKVRKLSTVTRDHNIALITAISTNKVFDKCMLILLTNVFHLLDGIE